MRFRVLAGFSCDPCVSHRLRTGTDRNLLRYLLYEQPGDAGRSLIDAQSALRVTLKTITQAKGRWSTGLGTALADEARLRLPVDLSSDLWEFRARLDDARRASDRHGARALLEAAEAIFVASETAEATDQSPRQNGNDPLAPAVRKIEQMRIEARHQWAALALLDKRFLEAFERLVGWTSGRAAATEDAHHLADLWHDRLYAAQQLEKGREELTRFPHRISDLLQDWCDGYRSQLVAAVAKFDCEATLEPASNVRLPPSADGAIPRSGEWSLRGRQDDLDRLHAQLSRRGEAVVVGPGGQGKTALALEYVDRYRDHYELVAWVRAGSPEEIPDQYRNFIGQGNDQRFWAIDPVQPAKDLLSRVECLVVLDDAVDAAALHPYLPSKATLLVTTRNYGYAANRELVMELEPLPRPVVEDWLQQALERPTEHSVLAELASALDGLPLAIVQAIAYINGHPGEMPSTFLAKLAEKGNLTLWRDPPRDCGTTVAGIVAVAHQDLSRTMPNAVDLLRHLAYLAPEPFPVKHLNGVVAGDDAGEMVAALRRCGIVRTSATHVTPCRVIQEVTRADLDHDDEKRYVGAWVRHLDASVPPIDEEVFGWMGENGNTPDAAGKPNPLQEIGSHILVVISHVAALKCHPPQVTALACAIAKLMIHHAAYDTARIVLDQVIAAAETEIEPDHRSMSVALRCRGFLEQQLGRPAQAVELYQRALTIEVATYGPSDPEVARTLVNLGNAQMDLGRLEHGRDCYERALRIQHAEYGTDHPEVARTLVNIGRSISPERGALLLSQALTVLQRECGPEHPQVARVLVNLGCAWGSVAGPHPAVPLFERAADIYEKAYGRANPWLANTLVNLGIAREDLDDLRMALQYYEQAVEMLWAAYGGDHPETTWAVSLRDAAMVQLSADGGGNRPV